MVVSRGVRLGLGDRVRDSHTRPIPRSSSCIDRGGLMGCAWLHVLACVGCVGCGGVTRRVYGMSYGNIDSLYAARGRSGFGI